MSDQMKRNIPLPQSQGFMGAAKDPVKKNMSALNSIDLAAMKQSGEFTPNMTVNDVLMKLGIDPNGPAQQLVEFGKKQIENADMAGKMTNIANDSQGVSAQGTPPTEPALPAGLEGLLGAGNG